MSKFILNEFISKVWHAKYIINIMIVIETKIWLFIDITQSCCMLDDEVIYKMTKLIMVTNEFWGSVKASIRILMNNSSFHVITPVALRFTMNGHLHSLSNFVLLSGEGRKLNNALQKKKKNAVESFCKISMTLYVFLFKYTYDVKYMIFRQIVLHLVHLVYTKKLCFTQK